MNIYFFDTENNSKHYQSFSFVMCTLVYWNTVNRVLYTRVLNFHKIHEQTLLGGTRVYHVFIVQIIYFSE